MINLKGTGLLNDLLADMTNALKEHNFLLVKHLHREFGETTLHNLVYSYQSLDGKSGMSLTTSFAGNPEEWAVDILCANPFNDAFWAKRPTSQKKEELVGDYLKHRGFKQVFDIPIQSESEARYFFQTMGCSHENMKRDYPLRYEEYKALRIAEDLESSWARKGKLLDDFTTENLKKQWQRLTGEVSELVSETIGVQIPVNKSTRETAPGKSENDQEREIDTSSVNNHEAETAATSPGSHEIEAAAFPLNGSEIEEDIPSITMRSPHIANAVKHYEDIIVKRKDKEKSISNLRQARKFFMEMKGNHQRMRTEFPERYEEYRSVNVTKAHEDKWRKKLRK